MKSVQIGGNIFLPPIFLPSTVPNTIARGAFLLSWFNKGPRHASVAKR